MLLAVGDTSACGIRLVATGEGVLSARDDWYPDPAGLRPFTLNEAADVSKRREDISRPTGRVIVVTKKTSESRTHSRIEAPS